MIKRNSPPNISTRRRGSPSRVTAVGAPSSGKPPCLSPASMARSQWGLHAFNSDTAGPIAEHPRHFVQKPLLRQRIVNSPHGIGDERYDARVPARAEARHHAHVRPVRYQPRPRELRYEHGPRAFGDPRRKRSHRFAGAFVTHGRHGEARLGVYARVGIR